MSGEKDLQQKLDEALSEVQYLKELTNRLKIKLKKTEEKASALHKQNMCLNQKFSALVHVFSQPDLALPENIPGADVSSPSDMEEVDELNVAFTEDLDLDEGELGVPESAEQAAETFEPCSASTSKAGMSFNNSTTLGVLNLSDLSVLEYVTPSSDAVEHKLRQATLYVMDVCCGCNQIIKLQVKGLKCMECGKKAHCQCVLELPPCQPKLFNIDTAPHSPAEQIEEVLSADLAAKSNLDVITFNKNKGK